MIKPDINKEELLSKKSLTKHFIYFICLILFIYFSLFLITVKVNESLYTTIRKNIIDSRENPITACMVLSCSKITIQDGDKKEYLIVTNTDEGFKLRYAEKDDLSWLTESWAFKGIYNARRVQIPYNNKLYTIDNGIYLKMLFNYVIILSIFIIPILFIIYLYILNRLEVSKRINKGLYKNELETQLQRDVSEVLHHELGVPISVIETNTKELMYNRYPCLEHPNRICQSVTLDSNFDCCAKCTRKDLNQATDDQDYILFTDLLIGVERVKAVLGILAGSKHIRFSNGTVPIHNIIENIVSTINNFKLKKLKSVYVNKELFDTYSVRKRVGNGNLLNIIHVLLNNATEAYADEVVFKAELVDDLFMNIYITDNGTGIKNSKGEYVADQNIFKLGYSTKDIHSDRYKLTLLDKILNFLGFNSSPTNKPSRGIGLFISKSIVVKGGGDLTLVSTSEKGTCFKLTIPIKKTLFT